MTLKELLRSFAMWISAIVEVLNGNAVSVFTLYLHCTYTVLTAQVDLNYAGNLIFAYYAGVMLDASTYLLC